MIKKLVLFSLVCVSNSFALANNVGSDLKDLAAMTFSCPAAALNAAARVAAQAPTEGNYQFVSFTSDGKDQTYSVSFESNVHSEPRLNYEVSLYCQQGWDPNATVKVVLKK